MPARANEVEAMYQQLKDILIQIKFINRGDPEHMMQSIRNMLNRASLTPREVRILRGISSTMRYVSNKVNEKN